METRHCAFGPAASCDPLASKLCRIHEGLRCPSRCSTIGFPLVPNLTNLPAGGLRSRRSVGAAIRPQGPSARRVGANTPYGLASAKRQHSPSHRGPPGTAILGSESSRVVGTERNSKPKSNFGETRLLHSKRISLGRSATVSGQRAMEGRFGPRLLEWPRR